MQSENERSLSIRPCGRRPDLDTIYEVPLYLRQEGLDDRVTELLNVWSRAPKLERWEKIVESFKQPKSEVTIGIVSVIVDGVAPKLSA